MADSRIDELRKRLERDPGSRLFAQLAEEHRKAGDHGEAIRVARAGLALHPVYASARLTLGRALLDAGDPAGAHQELSQALREAPDNILASRFLGQALESLGDLGGALHQYLATLKMAPGDRQLESQVRALQLRLQGPAGGPTAGAEEEPEAGELAPTIRIHMPGDPVARPGRAPAPPPLPPAMPAARATAPPVLATMPVPVTVPPPPPPAPEPVEVTERLPARLIEWPVPAPAPVAEPPVAAQAPTDSAFASQLPETGGEAYERDVAPTLPPNAVRVEDVVFDATPPEEPTLAAPAPEPPPGASGGPQEPPPLVSSTLAELYLRQGVVGQAMEVYRQVVAEDPANAKARARLAELESDLPLDPRAARRRALERTIAGLETLLEAVRRRQR